MKPIFVLLILSTQVFSEMIISEKQLLQRLSYSNNNYGFKEALETPSGLTVYSFEADYKILKMKSNNVTLDVIMELLYQSPDEPENNNLKIVRYYIRLKKKQPILMCSTIECHDNICENYYKNSIEQSPFKNTVSFNQTYNVKISFDSTNNLLYIRHNNEEKKLSFNDCSDNIKFKVARIAVSVKNYNKSKCSGFIEVLWDNIKINEQPYDDFNDSNINSIKWKTLFKEYKNLY